MFDIKKDSIVEDYIVNSKHTVKCASKEFQIAEECNCWRVEFAKIILANQKELSDLELVEKTLAEQYLEFIQTKWDPKYNFGFELDTWKKTASIVDARAYLNHFGKYYPAKDIVPGRVVKTFFDKIGNEHCHFYSNICEDFVITKWWDIKNRVKLDLPEEKEPLYVWDSFVAWCLTDETPRKAFGIELKEETEFTVKIHEDKIAHIPSVKCKDSKELSVEITGLSLVKDSTNPIIKTISVIALPKARKLKRIKVHSNYIKCTNKSRRVVSTLTSEITCGHCLKLGKKKGLWV